MSRSNLASLLKNMDMVTYILSDPRSEGDVELLKYYKGRFTEINEHIREEVAGEWRLYTLDDLLGELPR